MTNTIHHNFPRVADAESARNALVAAGFQAAGVTLNPHKTPQPDAATSTVSNIMDALTPGGPAAAAHAREQGGALLSVDIDDNDKAEEAEAIMRNFGGKGA